MLKLNRLHTLSLGLVASFFAGCSSHVFESSEAAWEPKALTNIAPEYAWQESWSTDTGTNSGEQLRFPMGHDAQTIYTVGHNGVLTAVDLKTGAQRWTTHLDETPTAGPGVGGGRVVIATKSMKLHAFSAKDGHSLWTAELPGTVWGQPTVTAQQVVLKTIAGTVMTLSAQDGKTRWQYAHGTPEMMLRADSSPKISGSHVMAGFADGQLVALDRSSGHEVWQRLVVLSQGLTDIERMVDISADPVVRDNVIYVASYQGALSALALANGDVLWHHPFSGYSNLAVDSERVVATDDTSRVWALGRNDGHVEWKQLALLRRGVTAPTFIDGKLAIADHEGFLHLLSPDSGKFLARTRVTHSAISVAPFSQGHQLYVLTDAGDLHSYRLRKVA